MVRLRGKSIKTNEDRLELFCADGGAQNHPNMFVRSFENWTASSGTNILSPCLIMTLILSVLGQGYSFHHVRRDKQEPCYGPGPSAVSVHECVADWPLQHEPYIMQRSSGWLESWRTLSISGQFQRVIVLNITKNAQTRKKNEQNSKKKEGQKRAQTSQSFPRLR